MNVEERAIFLAKPGGKTAVLVDSIEQERKAAHSQRLAFLKSKGKFFRGLWASDNGVTGFVVRLKNYPHDVPKGYRVAKTFNPGPNEVVIVPDGRQRATYKELRQEFRDQPRLPDLFAFSNRLGCSGILRGMRMLFATYEKVGKHLIVTVPKPSAPRGVQFVPADCKQLKLSQYFALKEKHAKN